MSKSVSLLLSLLLLLLPLACVSDHPDDSRVSRSGVLIQSGPLSTIDAKVAEDDFFHLLNEERARNGKAPMVRDALLDPLSKDWSAHMAAVYARTGTIQDPADTGNCERSALCHRPKLVTAVDPSIAWTAIAENVGVGGDIQGLHDAFVASHGHFVNLTGNYNRVGIGVVKDAGHLWVTFNFLAGPPIEGPSLETIGPTSPAAGFTALDTPVRLYDSRTTNALASWEPRKIHVADVARLSAAVSLDLNLTVVAPSADGFATAYPCAVGPPNASNINYRTRQTVANHVISSVVDAEGNICLLTSASAHMIVDVSGFYAASSGLRYTAQTPVRLLDTRGGAIGATFSVPTSAAPGHAVALNVTVTAPASDGYLTAYPCGVEIPIASNLNFTAGQTVPNMVVSRVGPDSKVCFVSSVSTHLIVDQQGTFGDSGSFLESISPFRIADTRVHRGAVRVKAGAVASIPVAGAFGVPASIGAAALNLTVTNPRAAGFLSAYPCGSTPPTASNLNFTAGQTVANAAIVALGPEGNVCLYASADTDFIVDLSGVFRR